MRSTLCLTDRRGVSAYIYEAPLQKKRVYRLFVKIGRRWKWLCDLNADSHEDAFRQAMLRLEPENFDKQIRLEEKSQADKQR